MPSLFKKKHILYLSIFVCYALFALFSYSFIRHYQKQILYFDQSDTLFRKLWYEISIHYNQCLQYYEIKNSRYQRNPKHEGALFRSSIESAEKIDKTLKTIFHQQFPDGYWLEDFHQLEDLWQKKYRIFSQDLRNNHNILYTMDNITKCQKIGTDKLLEIDFQIQNLRRQSLHNIVEMITLLCFVPLLFFAAILAMIYLREKKRNQILYNYLKMAESSNALFESSETIVKPTPLPEDPKNIQLENAIQWLIYYFQVANHSKDHFFAAMSHEIRTPLNGIIGFLSNLAETRLNDQQQQYLQIIESSARALLHVINEIMDYSKIRAGQMVLENVPFNIRTLLEERIAVSKQLAKNKNLKVSLDFPGTDPVIIRADPIRIRQIIDNLLNNAVKFTEHGEVILEIRQRNKTEEKIDLEIAVQDSGIGIPLKQQNQLFKPYSQADSTISRRYGGTGLGLSISSKLVKLMGGELKLKSKPDEGSCFSFVLHTVPARPEEEVHLSGMYRIILPTTELKKHWALLVDDTPTNLFLLETICQSVGLPYRTAENGRAALHLCQKQRFDLIFMDMQMPIMDGYTAIREIRKLPNSARTNIIALTASAFQEDIDQAFGAGSTGFIPKPFERDQLLICIAEALSIKPERELREATTTQESYEESTVRHMHDFMRDQYQISLGEIKMILAQTVADWRPILDNLTVYTQQGNADETIAILQKLKGQLAAIGLLEYSEHTTTIMDIIKEGDSKKAQLMISSFVQRLGRIFKNLEQNVTTHIEEQ